MEATEIAAAVRRGDRSAVEVVAEAVARIEASQPVLNAFTLVDPERALARARAIDRAVAAGIDPGRLAGVPVALKDLIDEAGVPNTRGAGFPPTMPERSATVVRRIEAAGGVVVGRTGLHEFAFGFTSENEHFGPVRNPWEPALSPGGSSGGSAVAVAAGTVPLAVGTDTGGSVRVPAALCGIVGLKPTHGRVPLTGVYPLAPSLDTVGPLARSVADAALLHRVMAGDDPDDPWSVPRPAVEPPPVDLDGLRVALPHQWSFDPPTTEIVRRAFDAAVEDLARLGAVVEEVAVPALAPTEASSTGAYVEVARVHRERWSRHPDGYGPSVAARLQEAFAVPADALVDALAWRAAARHALERLFARFDVVAVPTVGGTRKVIGVDTMDLHGEPVPHRRLLATFTAPVNGVGLPAIALPLPATGVPPASLQLVGPAFSEERLLALGTALEAAGVVAVATPPSWYGD